MRFRPIITFALAALALILGVLLAPRIRRGNPPPSVLTQIQRLNQLITVRYSIQRVVGLKEQKQPIGEESLLLMVQGEVQAGVDLAHLDPAGIRYADPQTVTVLLPNAQILNVFLDEKHTKVWDRRVTWWTPWVDYNPDLEHKAREQALNDVRSAALEMGILQQAQKNAELAVRDFLEALRLKATVKSGVS